MRVRRRTLALVLPVALVLGLGGCSSDDEPEPGASATTTTAPTAPASETPAPTESPEPEPTATGPTPPPRPAAMDDTGKKGAQAAAEYFISLLGYAFQSGESESIREMSLSATCISCENFAERADSHRDSDYVVVGGETTLSGLKVSDRDSLTGGFAVSGAFETSEMTVSTSDGENLGVSRSDDGFIQIDVLHDENTWRVMAVVTDQDSAE